MHKCYGCEKPLKRKYVCDDCVSKVFEGIFWESLNGYLGGNSQFEDVLDSGYTAICKKIDMAFEAGKIQRGFSDDVEIKDGESLLELMKVGR